MNKRFRPLWIVPCAVLVLLLCAFLDETAEKKNDVDPYLLSFSDNCAGYEDDSLCQLDALTPWDWDSVWFIPAGKGAAHEVTLPGLAEEIETDDAAGDKPAAYCLAFIKDDALVYLLSDQCIDAEYRLELSNLPAADSSGMVCLTNNDSIVFRKTPAEGGKINLLTLQKPVVG